MKRKGRLALYFGALGFTSLSGFMYGFREVFPFLILVVVIGVVVETIYHRKGWL